MYSGKAPTFVATTDLLSAKHVINTPLWVASLYGQTIHLAFKIKLRSSSTCKYLRMKMTDDDFSKLQSNPLSGLPAIINFWSGNLFKTFGNASNKISIPLYKESLPKKRI